MNNFFNFKIAEFNERYGTDWEDFKLIIDDYTDYHFQKIWELYHLDDINRMSEGIVNQLLKFMEISYSRVESLAEKKLKLRKNISRNKEKGFASQYLEELTGLVGAGAKIYSGYDLGAWRWMSAEKNTPHVPGARWVDPEEFDQEGDLDFIRFPTEKEHFKIYFDVKTIDDSQLDLIVQKLRASALMPAFYNIYLISIADGRINILKEI